MYLCDHQQDAKWKPMHSLKALSAKAFLLSVYRRTTRIVHKTKSELTEEVTKRYGEKAAEAVDIALCYQTLPCDICTKETDIREMVLCPPGRRGNTTDNNKFFCLAVCWPDILVAYRR